MQRTIGKEIEKRNKEMDGDQKSGKTEWRLETDGQKWTQDRKGSGK